MDIIKHKILIVDDERTNIKVLEFMLDDKIEIKSITDSRLLIEESYHYKPDVILLDIMMPHKNGYECLKDLKYNHLTLHIPVIMITHLIDQETIKRTIDLGAFDYIKKPFYPNELYSKVITALNYKINSDKLIKYKPVYESLVESKRIQDSMLPCNDLRKLIFKKIEILSIAKDVVSGDFYWFNVIDDKKHIFLGDCIGHGLPGAMLSIMVMTFIKSFNYKDVMTSDIFRSLSNNIKNIINNIDTYTIYDGLDAALLVIDDKDKENILVDYSGARIDLIVVSKNNTILVNNTHIKPYISNNNYYLFRIIADCSNIDRTTYQEDYTNHHLTLTEGDRIFIWTDGIYEQFGLRNDKKIKRYSKKRFFNSLLDNQYLANIARIVNNISEEYYNWKGEFDQMDDITLIAIEL